MQPTDDFIIPYQSQLFEHLFFLSIFITVYSWIHQKKQGTTVEV